MKIENILKLAQDAGFHPDIKIKFRIEAVRYLESIATQLNLKRETYDLYYNTGGVASSGDATLHHDKFYLSISESGAMYRTCHGRKDYVGGANQWIIGFGDALSFDAVIHALQKIIA